MLILTRRYGESIMIGDDIKITIVGVDDYRVKVGVSAPRDIEVHREEIYYSNKRKKAEAEKQQELDVSQTNYSTAFLKSQTRKED